MRQCIRRLNLYLRGWLGFFWICTEAEELTLKRLDGHIRRRLRATTLKQWRRQRTRVRRFIALGVKPSVARRSAHAGARGLWAQSKSSAAHQGLSNKYFAKRGLFSLHESWRRKRALSGIVPDGQPVLSLTGRVAGGLTAGTGIRTRNFGPGVPKSRM